MAEVGCEWTKLAEYGGVESPRTDGSIVVS